MLKKEERLGRRMKKEKKREGNTIIKPTKPLDLLNGVQVGESVEECRKATPKNGDEEEKEN